jgi:hypothetical protein
LIILVSGATETHARYASTGRFGHLVTPRNGNAIGRLRGMRLERCDGLPWAGDNDAFHGFDAARFARMLWRFAGVPGCLFVAVPDVVGDSMATRRRFERWGPIVAECGYPLAFVLQDGERSAGVPWSDVAAVFVGGSTAWKESDDARRLVVEAKERGKWAHMGRVNTRRRLRLAIAWGCDSVDGSAFSRWPDKFFPTAVRWLGELSPRGQASLF